MKPALRLLFALLAPLVLAPAAAAHPGPGITDAPGTGQDGGSVARRSAPSPLPRANVPVPNRRGQGRLDLRLAGSLALEPAAREAHADVMGYGNLAFVGKWRESCPGTGVDVIDISRVDAPRKISDTADHANTSMEDMQAIGIGERDVLLTGLQDCRNPGPPGLAGLELHDITDPARPEVLGYLPTGSGGVHELDVTRTADGRVLALLAVPSLEATTLGSTTVDEAAGDLLIVDITAPTRPEVIGEYGVIDDPRFGLDFYLDVPQGGDARTYLHSVRASEDGRRAYLSYWDAGVITLDITEPERPVVLGRTGYEPGEDGDAHSVDEARGGDVLVQADEDLHPFALRFTSSAFEGERAAVEAAFGPRLADRANRGLAGEVAPVGRGCPAGAVAAGSPEDPYLTDPAGRVALIERGGCAFNVKVARAQLAGATAVLIYNSAAGGEGLVLPGGAGEVTLPDGTAVTIAIPTVSVPRSVGLALAGESGPPATVRVGQEFNGWGYLRIWDTRDPANPVQLSTFATPNSLNPEVATDGVYSVHNPEVVGDRMYVSWYSDGVRAVDITRPAAPREIGAWVGEDRPAGAPPVDIWSVVPHRGVLLASDRNYGLYVLRRGP